MIQLSMQALPAHGSVRLSAWNGTHVINVLPNQIGGIDLHFARDDRLSRDPLQEREFYVLSPWGVLPEGIGPATYVGGCTVRLLPDREEVAVLHVFEITSATKETLQTERRDATSQLIRIAHNLQI